MLRLRCHFHWLLACIAIAVLSAFAIALPPRLDPPVVRPVIVEPWGERDEQTFDARNPPADMPPIAKNEFAVAWAQPWLEWSNGPSDGRWDHRTRILTVTAAGEITLKGHSLLRLPDNASAALRAHEVGHDRLNAVEWERSAGAVAADAMKGFVGMQFVGSGPDNEAAERDAWVKVQAESDRRMKGVLVEIARRMDVRSERYDAVTNHGRSRIVSADDGVTAALRLPVPASQPAATRPAPTHPVVKPRPK